MKDTEKEVANGKQVEGSVVVWGNTEKVDSSVDVDTQVKDAGYNETLGPVVRAAMAYSEEFVFLMNSEMSV